MTRRRLLIGVILALFFLPGMARAAGPLVTAGWLKEHLRDPGLVILDIRGRLSNTTRADYLAAGVRLIWVVYPGRRQVHEHRPGHAMATFTADQYLSGHDVLPGFTCQIELLLPSD